MSIERPKPITTPRRPNQNAAPRTASPYTSGKNMAVTAAPRPPMKMKPPTETDIPRNRGRRELTMSERTNNQTGE